MPALLRRMGAAVTARGPDDAGEWFDTEAGIGLTHRRLSVLELSVAGHQPMLSESASLVLSYNGEIYNHLELRRALEAEGRAPAWKGRSDTETLLAGFSTWGVEQTLQRAVGMFAFALWNRATRSLTLGRDRAGEKPLYYGWQGNVFLFGSELKALRAHPAFRGEVNRDALSLLLRHNYIPAPFAIYSGVHKLPPGSLLSVSLQRPEPVVHQYWSGLEAALKGHAQPFVGGEAEAVAALESTLRQAIAQQMVADVPVGAFLSGGVDSSTVVALMQTLSSRPVKTFTVGFNEGSFDEAVHAKAVAAHLHTEHEELYVTAAQALEVVPRLPKLYDEPFADSSQIPTVLVAQLARRYVTVSLSGDAGDELFCGYRRYILARRLWRMISPFPIALRRALSRSMQTPSLARMARFAKVRSEADLSDNRTSNWLDRSNRLAGLLDASTVDDLYRRLVSNWTSPDSVVIGSNEPRTLLQTGVHRISELSDIERMMALDLVTYLPDDNLAKVDRATMSTSLESRVPLLDHRVIEFAWSLPEQIKLRNGVAKWPLRQVLYRYVPPKLIDRPKTGFRVPIGAWLRGPLRDWAETLLTPARLRNEGYFQVDQVRTKWEEHMSGRRNWHHHIWCVLMFQAWLDAQS